MHLLNSGMGHLGDSYDGIVIAGVLEQISQGFVDDLGETATALKKPPVRCGITPYEAGDVRVESDLHYLAFHHMTPKTASTQHTRIAPIHNGDSTHHQDQSMTWHSLRVINTMASNPVNPIPPDDDVLSAIDFALHKWGKAGQYATAIVTHYSESLFARLDLIAASASAVCALIVMPVDALASAMASDCSN